MDKIGSQTVKQTTCLADSPNGTNYRVSKQILPSRSSPSISPTFFSATASPWNSFFTSNGGIQTYDSKSPSAACTASVPPRTYEVYGTVGRVSRRRFDRYRPRITRRSLEGAFVQKGARQFGQKRPRAVGVLKTHSMGFNVSPMFFQCVS